MIRKRISLIDDGSIYRIVVSELLPYALESNPETKVSPKIIRQRLQRNVTYVAAEGLTTPYGFISMMMSPNVLIVDMLAVEEAQQGNGIGKMLMAAAENSAYSRECAFIKLFVDRSNYNAQRFYRHLGYQVAQYIPEVKCYEMQKSL
jgi:ribosomal protein S18 acetylase RimI-like enzyme